MSRRGAVETRFRGMDANDSHLGRLAGAAGPGRGLPPSRDAFSQAALR